MLNQESIMIPQIESALIADNTDRIISQLFLLSICIVELRCCGICSIMFTKLIRERRDLNLKQLLSV